MTTLRVMQRPLCLRDALLLIFAFAICCEVLAVAAAEPDSKWEAPASERQRKNPLPANEPSLSAGKAVYVRPCAECHGHTGNRGGHSPNDLPTTPAKGA